VGREPGAALEAGPKISSACRSITSAVRSRKGSPTFAGGGAAVVLSPSGWRNQAAVRNIWKLVERYKPEVFGGVPTVLAASLHIPVAGADISSIRYSSGGGSAIPCRRRQGAGEAAGCAGARGLRHDRDFERAHDRVHRPPDPPRLGRSRRAVQQGAAW
jgi:hypothetical protein